MSLGYHRVQVFGSGGVGPIISGQFAWMVHDLDTGARGHLLDSLWASIADHQTDRGVLSSLVARHLCCQSWQQLHLWVKAASIPPKNGNK